MPTRELIYTDKSKREGVHIAVKSSAFDKFGPQLLGLGDIGRPSSGEERFSALAAIYDLQGFTSFCDRRDPHLVVPEFIERFLSWLFAEIKREFEKERLGQDVLLWGRLPMFAKFMGDGVLLLWEIPKDQRHGGALAIGNVVVRLHRITRSYREEFLPAIDDDFAKVPKILRCGGAFGDVLPVGNKGDYGDYVGACINLASRLQKAGGLSFAFARAGCDPKKCFRDQWKDAFITKSWLPRGFGDAERILVDKAEFEALPERSKKEFSEVHGRTKLSKR